MALIRRETLSDWVTYKSDNLKTDGHVMSYACLDLPNGPYASLDDAKTEASGILDIYTSVTASDLYDYCESELSSDKNTLIIKNARIPLSDGHRPLAEAGSPLNTLDVEFNILKYMNDIKSHAKASWITEKNKVKIEDGAIKLIDKSDKVKDSSFSNPHQKHNDSIDRFFTALKVNNEESNYKDSFIALKKTITDPSSSSIVHFLNHLNLTFVFETSSVSVRNNYETYSDDFFSISSQTDGWHSDLRTHFIRESDTPVNWHTRSMFHLVDNYYGITISTNIPSGSYSVELMIDLINNFDKLHWDWETYPGNLYVGNVCKILS